MTTEIYRKYLDIINENSQLADERIQLDEGMMEMWTALEKYQPYADKRGFGDAWLKMTTERTAFAARDAEAAASSDAAEPWEAWAAWAAAAASWAEAEEAIRYINRAIKLEETK